MTKELLVMLCMLPLLLAAMVWAIGSLRWVRWAERERQRIEREMQALLDRERRP